MIKEREVLKSINIRNKKYFLSKGYDVSELKFGETMDIYIKVEDISKSSSDKVTAVCEICGGENKILISKYYQNCNRNNKGYYSCFKCKNIEKEKTCIKKYGKKSYSMTDEFIISESKKWKGIQKGSGKMKKTMMEKYGVESYFQTEEMREKNRKWMSSDEFKQKSKSSLIQKYGVDHYSKTDRFKSDISKDKKDIIDKIKSTFMEKYGVEWISKSDIWKDKYNENLPQIRERIKNTCMERYGVDNVSKVESIKNRIISTKIQNEKMVCIEKLPKWDQYKRVVRKLTNRNKKMLYENWDGYDYYDGESIKKYLSEKHTSTNYPTIDHKVSVLYGFLNGISEEDISSIENLCITKRTINSSKTFYTEGEFKNI